MFNPDRGKTKLNWLLIRLIPSRFIDFSEFDTEAKPQPDHTLRINGIDPIALHDFTGRKILYHPGLDVKDSVITRPENDDV